MASAIVCSRIVFKPSSGTFNHRQLSHARASPCPSIVRCSTKDEQPLETKLEQEVQSAKTEVGKPPVSVPKKSQESIWELFSFSGPVPETVNGRLAMLGFTAALAIELSSGTDLVGQIDNGGINYFVGAALLFTLASLIPLFQGVSAEKASGGLGGIFTSQAETWNGRAAMLGLVALALTEFVKGSPLI